jgi:hypothetical protein
MILNSHIELIAEGELTLAGGGVSSAQGNPQTVSWQQVSFDRELCAGFVSIDKLCPLSIHGLLLEALPDGNCQPDGQQ